MPQFTGSTSVGLHAGYVSVAEITVDAAAAIVWPHVLDLGSWINDFHFEHVSGPARGEGEVLHLWAIDAEGLGGVRAAERRPENAIVLKTLTIVPGRLWYGINPSTDEPGGVRGTGVNLVLLTETAGRTLVTAIRSKESLCPTPEVRDATQDEMTRYQPIAQGRWTDKYLPRLKELAERRR